MKKKKAARAKKKSPQKAVKKSKARKPAKKPSKKKTAKKSASKAKKAKAPKVSLGELAGVVTHYFPHVQAAVVKVKTSKLRLGDSLHFKGHTTDFKMSLDSMQMDHKPIQAAGKGKEIGVQVPGRVREGDTVYRQKKS